MRSVLAAVALLAAAGSASATPLTLSYCITDDGSGTYHYSFTLTLDNHDGSWEPGQGFNLIILGDGGPEVGTTLPDFVGDEPLPPPFDNDGWSGTGGGHNGPTLLDYDDIFVGWVPAGIGDSISFSGTSASLVVGGAMLWSDLFGTGVHANFEPAVDTGPCGCPADFNHDGFVSGDDFDLYVAAFELGDESADFNGDGFVSGDDFDAFVAAFEAGC